MLKQEFEIYELTNELLRVGGSLRDTINALLSHVITHFDAHAADVLFCDASAQVFRFGLGRGFRSPAFEKSKTRIDLFASQVVQAQRAIHIRNLKKYENELSSAEMLLDGFMSYAGAPLVYNGQIEGVVEIFARMELAGGADWLKQLEYTVAKAAVAIHNAVELRRLEFANTEMAQAFDATIAAMAHALELREQESAGHTVRVAEMTVQFARAVGFSEAELVHVRRGALLHDIGKLGIPENILLKPEALTEEEWATIREHPTTANKLLSSIEYLKPALAIPYCHHEKWDGTGYPRGLKGGEIPLEARVFAVVDVWDALRSNRPFRQPWPEEKVIQHILDRGGRQFEQRLADLFVKLIEAGKFQRKKEAGEMDFNHVYSMQIINT